MRPSRQDVPLQFLPFYLQNCSLIFTKVWPALLLCLLLPAIDWCQDSSAESGLRGNRAELALTVRDSSGDLIDTPALVKILRSGTPADQGTTKKGRAFFILNTLGEYTIIVDAAGYEPAQKDVSVAVALKMELDIYLKRSANSGGATVGVPGRPVLAPKAKEEFDKGLQALGQNKVKEAEKHVEAAMKLAPNHPDVLYLQGVVDLRQNKFADAQSVLEKATQIDPGHASAFGALGMSLSDQGKYEAAIAPLEKSLQLDPAAGWETHWALARAYYHHGDYEAALKTAQQALTKSNGKAPEIEILVAQSLTAVGRFEDSAQALRDFLKNHPDRPEAATARRYLDRLTADGKIRSQ